MEPQFDRHNVREFFEEMSPSYFDKYGSAKTEGHSFRSRKQRTLACIDAAGPWTGKHVLDIGCGPGVMVAELLARSFAEVHAIDVSPGMVEDCRKRFHGVSALTCEVGDATRLAYPDRRFDLVLAMGLVEYFDDADVDVIYREVTRVLQPGGKLLVTYPNASSVYRRLSVRPWLSRTKRLFERLRGDGIRRVAKQTFHEEQVARDAARHGLNVSAVRYYNYKVTPYPFDQLFPRPAVFLAEQLESIDRGPAQYLGTGFIVLFERTR
ncbi:MAG: methyltransferase domain-containing protein [Deltaproteobacteria bacterium]|nr:methyltransferase domain-containing protein [Deltaproteobacteria bacterium]